MFHLGTQTLIQSELFPIQPTNTMSVEIYISWQGNKYFMLEKTKVETRSLLTVEERFVPLSRALKSARYRMIR